MATHVSQQSGIMPGISERDDFEPSDAGIYVEGLHVSYGGATALHHVSFSIESGRLCGLVGMNGAGKSTLFKALMGVIRADAGTIRFSGASGKQSRKLGAISYVPQQGDVDWSFPLLVRDVVMMGRYGMQNWLRTPHGHDHETVDEAITRVGLADQAGTQIGELSGGQRKRVFLARGLAQRAQVLLLDEPFAGVDKHSEHTIVRILKQLASEGATVLVSSHDLHALPDLCEEALLINKTIIAHDDIRRVLRPERLAKAFGLGGEAYEHVRGT
ncbi:MAG: metal ABC transporter ATP-binding protein [Bifidobacterium psychraerophilum]